MHLRVLCVSVVKRDALPPQGHCLNCSLTKHAQPRILPSIDDGNAIGSS